MFIKKRGNVFSVFLNLCLTVLILTKFSYAQDSLTIHFLHHSTGANLITQGNIYEMFEQYNTDCNTNYIFSDEWSTPSGNYPYDYYIDTFSPERLAEYTSAYNVIIFKHCYPASDIAADTGEPDINSSRKSLENYKLQYRALRDRFDSYPDNKFLVMTIPPRHRLATTAEKAARAIKFVQWVNEEFLNEDGNKHNNIGIFDFHVLLADSNGYLKYEYEINHNISDSHPNQLANETICPIFFDAIIDFCQNPTVVPVELIAFNANIQKRYVKLNWATSTEINNYGFDVERKTDKSHYKKIGFVTGNSTSTKVNHYQYVDNLTSPGKYYYRLKQINHDGSYTYSKDVSVTLTLTNTAYLSQNYPNPFNSSTQISFQLSGSHKVILTIFDLLGNPVQTLVNKELRQGKHTLNWDGNDDNNQLISSGCYIYCIRIDDLSEKRKMIFLK